MGPDRIEVLIPIHVLPLVVAALDGGAQGGDRVVEAAEEGEGAGEVVVEGRLGGAEADKALVDRQPLLVVPLTGVDVPESDEAIEVAGVLRDGGLGALSGGGKA